MRTDGISVTALKRAIEGRDTSTLTGFYADGAVMRIIDRDNPPSNLLTPRTPRRWARWRASTPGSRRRLPRHAAPVFMTRTGTRYCIAASHGPHTKFPQPRGISTSPFGECHDRKRSA